MGTEKALARASSRKKRVDLLNKIEDGLFLGSLLAASDIELLPKHGINAVLTLDACPIPNKVIKSLKHYKFVPVCDTVKDNLLSHFQECVAFIDDSKKTGNVLVHCYFGVSRSSTVVIAYLMFKYEISLEEALQRVVACRPCVSPNQGFLAQLKLFQEMGYRVDLGNLRFKIFSMATAADKLKKEQGIPKILASMIMPDPHLSIASDEDFSPRSIYRCASCRRVVATEDNIIPHMRNQKHVWTDLRFDDLAKVQNLVCRHGIFLEPMAWMKNAFNNLQGKLHCPNCDAKLGSFTWLLGVSCSCSTRITPAFYIQQKKVDKMAFNRNHLSVSMPVLDKIENSKDENATPAENQEPTKADEKEETKDNAV